MSHDERTSHTPGESPVVAEEAAAATADLGPEREFTVAARSQWRIVVRRFLHHKLAVVSLVLLLVLFFFSLFGGGMWKYRTGDETSDVSAAPSLSHPMGTDSVGHDYYALVLSGSQKSVEIALVVALVSGVVGTLIGAIAGYYRGFVEALLMRLTDMLLVIPNLVIFAMLANKFSASGGGTAWLLLALCLAGVFWVYAARLVRGVFLSLREKDYVEAARALGASDRRIIFKHLLPNAIGPIIVNTTVITATAIIAETALSYLGLGVRYPDTSLGSLISTYQDASTTRPWLFYFPGALILLICLTINFVGDGLRDAFDPGAKRVRA